MSVTSSEKRFLLGASTLIVLTIALFSISTVALHFSTHQMFGELQVQAKQFQAFEQHGENLVRADQLYRSNYPSRISISDLGTVSIREMSR